VIPDDYHSTTNNNTLQHYVNSSEKYFTSDTQLVFLPGKHHLQTDLVLQNVSNVTLRGQKMINTIIYCNRSVRIVISNSAKINIQSLSIKECKYYQKEQTHSPLIVLNVFNCSNISIEDSVFMCQHEQCGLVLVNAVGIVNLYNISSSHLLITHNMTNSNSAMEISKYHHMGHSSHNHRALEILLYEHSQYIVINFFDTKLHFDKALKIWCSNIGGGLNKINFQKMKLTDVTLEDNAVTITILNGFEKSNTKFGTVIEFSNCTFAKINSSNRLTGPGLFALAEHRFYYISQYFSFGLKQCIFNNINITVILNTHTKKEMSSWGPAQAFTLSIQDSKFSELRVAKAVLWIAGAHLMLSGCLLK